jgi:hypothetical protein
LNASGVQGAAGKASAAFTRLGFLSSGTANDPRGLIDHSEIRYRAGDQAKALLLVTMVPGAQLVADLTLSGNGVVVVLGKHFQGVGTGATTATSTPANTPTTATTAMQSPEAACN